MKQTQNIKIFSHEEMNSAWDLFLQAKKVTLLTHTRPDGDGISACAALSLIGEKLGKSIETIYPSEPEFVIKRQPANIFINSHKQLPDIIIGCDTANYKRMYYPEAFKSIPLINIDHHISNSIEGTHNFVNANSSSACELLMELLTFWNPKMIDQKVAECLLVGILYDTQVFRIASTTSHTLRMAAELVDKGASLYNLKTELLSHKNPANIQLWSKILHTIKVLPEKQVALASISQKDLIKANLTISSIVGFSNFLAEITAIDTTLFFYETKDGKTKVSLRSNKRDVNKLASLFGGGGHKKASGIVSNLSMDELIQQIIKSL